MDKVTKKIPGELHKNISANVAPTAKNINMKHKFLHAFHCASPQLDRGTVEMILDFPEKLGQNSFIEAISTLSHNVRQGVTECINNLV